MPRSVLRQSLLATALLLVPPALAAPSSPAANPTAIADASPSPGTRWSGCGGMWTRSTIR
ncbi:hypothetical protein [Nitrospirillum sp. BR 11828]|uniref:hypothetical protein n=1 Tax=Nitrospirillum sp. BR 11828 TaxID=3104325 RepID=UPI002ACAC0F3|nr:hypothetical protein [Nitrospirillum sp. BR 11828]MDZ5649792.1 hypothetical protein [Nitrospirillum sp. BR 11828]